MNTTKMNESIITYNQKMTFGPVYYRENDTDYKITAKVRYDDDCRNGHNSFSITGDIMCKNSRGRWEDDSCGCIHDDIAKRFPELKHLIKWHLTSSDGPLHYVANTVYHASNRDCNGLLKGEVKSYETSLKFGEFPITFSGFSSKFIEFIQNHGGNLEVCEIEHRDNKNGGSYQFGPKYTFLGFCDEWYKCPFDTKQQAEQFKDAVQNYKLELVKTPNAWGEGKERDFDSARNSSVWPDATDEQLSLDKDQLTQLLLERLPKLIAEFRKEIEALGLIF